MDNEKIILYLDKELHKKDDFKLKIVQKNNTVNTPHIVKLDLNATIAYKKANKHRTPIESLLFVQLRITIIVDNPNNNPVK